MTKTFVQAETEKGAISFEVDDATGVGPERVSREHGAVVAKLDQPLDQALVSARPAAESVINTFRPLAPNEMSIEFGLKLDAQAGAVFAKAGIGAHFTVTMTWQPDRAGAQTAAAQA
jgi:Trypsin-co-occurring domain 1